MSEALGYKLLKAHDLIISPAFVVIKAANELHTKTTRLNEMGQTGLVTVLHQSPILLCYPSFECQRTDPPRSDFGALYNCKRIIDVNNKITNGFLDVRMSEQNLDCSQVACCLIDQQRFRPAHRMFRTHAHQD